MPLWAVPAPVRRRDLQRRLTRHSPSPPRLPISIWLRETRPTFHSPSGRTFNRTSCSQTARAYQTFRHRRLTKASTRAALGTCRGRHRSSSTAAAGKATATECLCLDLLPTRICGKTTLMARRMVRARIVGAQVRRPDNRYRRRSTWKIGEYFYMTGINMKLISVRFQFFGIQGDPSQLNLDTLTNAGASLGASNERGQ